MLSKDLSELIEAMLNQAMLNHGGAFTTTSDPIKMLGTEDRAAFAIRISSDPLAVKAQLEAWKAKTE